MAYEDGPRTTKIGNVRTTCTPRRWPLTLSCLLCTLIGAAASASAPQSGTSYHGRIVDASGAPVQNSSVQVRLQIRTPGAENCLLYEEIETLSTSGPDGLFSFALNAGVGVRTDSSGYAFDQIFSNRNQFSFTIGTCALGNTYTPSSADGRSVALAFRPDANEPYTILPAQTVAIAPLAIDTEQVGGFGAANLMRFDDTAAALNTTPFNSAQFTTLMSLINGGFLASSSGAGATLPVFAIAPSGTAPGTVWFNSATDSVQVNAGGTSTSIATISAPPTGTASGSLGGSYPAPTVAKLSGVAVTTSSLSGGNFLRYNGTSFTNINPQAGDFPSLASGLTGILPLANGGTATTNGSIAAMGPLAIAAGGANQNITLSPSGAGSGVITSSLGLGAPPTLALDNAGSGRFAGATIGGLDGELFYDNMVHAYKYYNASSGAWLSLAGGSTSFTGGAWTTSGSNLTYSAGNVGIGTATPHNLLSFSGNGPNTLRVERNAGGAAGSTLTVQAGGATSGATNKNGGALVISSGTATGIGSSTLSLQTAAPQSASANTDQLSSTQIFMQGNGWVGVGTTVATSPFVVGSAPHTVQFSSHFTDEYMVGVIGENVGTDGWNWTTGTDGVNNGGGAITQTVWGGMNFMLIPSTGATPQTFVDTAIWNYASGYIDNNSFSDSFAVRNTGVATAPAIYGSTNAGASITFDSTSNTSKGNLLLAPGGGAVGIGTSSPSAMLSVAGPIQTLAGLIFPDGTTMATAGAESGGSTSATNLNLAADSGANGFGAMIFSTHRKEGMRLVNAGGLGLGSQAPGQRFTVQGNMDVATALGIGTTLPVATIDIAGALRISGDVQAYCSSGQEGQQRYNYVVHAMEYCNGSSWSALGGVSLPSYQTAVATCNSASCTANCPGATSVIMAFGFEGFNGATDVGTQWACGSAWNWLGNCLGASSCTISTGCTSSSVILYCQ